MGALYHLKQRLVDFCNVIQQNVNRTDTVPSSAVVYSGLKALNDSLTTANNSVANINSHWWHMTNVGAPSGYKAVQIWFNANTVAPIFYSDTSGNCFVIVENWGSIGSTLYSVPKITINSSGSNSVNVYAAKSGSNIRLKFSFASSIPMGGLFNTDGLLQFRNQEFLDE